MLIYVGKRSELINRRGLDFCINQTHIIRLTISDILQ